MAGTITATRPLRTVPSLHLDLYSLLVVMIVLLGNATVRGVDLALVTLYPALFAVVLWQRHPVPRRHLMQLLAIGALALALILLSARIVPDYFPAYWLWSVKFLILAVLMLFGPPPTWPTLNHYIFLGFCLFVIAFSRYEYGRLYSFFGPNMLYRIYGLLFVLSMIQMVQSRVRQPFVHLGGMGLGGFVLVATGSVGALIMFLIPALLLLTLKPLQTRIIVLSVYALVAAGLGFYLLNSDSNLIARVFYKLDNLLLSMRIIGWDALLSQPFALFGHSYQYFGLANIWVEHYEYPHNLFIELYAYYGVLVFGIGFCCLHALACYHTKMSVEYIAFIVVFLGAQLSGDLSDNYGALALGVVLFARRKAEPAGMMQSG